LLYSWVLYNLIMPIIFLRLSSSCSVLEFIGTTKEILR
jgi:hypothetical protein